MANVAALPKFPTREEIPEAARIDARPWARKFLLDGEVRTWGGAVRPVSSPVCIRAADQTLAPAIIGEMPLLDRETALSALAAARRAWDSGRGKWPTLPVAGRIEAVEHFCAEMAKVREDVVRLTMWEIAKTRKDAESEFDRTL